VEFGSVAIELGCRVFEYVVCVLGSSRYGIYCIRIVFYMETESGLGCRVDPDGPVGEENFLMVYD
jgi:hypothetical protein